MFTLVLSFAHVATSFARPLGESSERILATCAVPHVLSPSNARDQVAVKERTIPKTTSGKIQRRRARTLLQTGGLDVVQELMKHLPSTIPTPEAVALPPSSETQGPADANEVSLPEPLTPEVKPGQGLLFLCRSRQTHFSIFSHPMVQEYSR